MRVQPVAGILRVGFRHETGREPCLRASPLTRSLKNHASSAAFQRVGGVHQVDLELPPGPGLGDRRVGRKSIASQAS